MSSSPAPRRVTPEEGKVAGQVLFRMFHRLLAFRQKEHHEKMRSAEALFLHDIEQVVRIQAAFRGYLVRRHFKREKEKLALERTGGKQRLRPGWHHARRENAAQLIQTFWRDRMLCQPEQRDRQVALLERRAEQEYRLATDAARCIARAWYARGSSRDAAKQKAKKSQIAYKVALASRVADDAVSTGPQEIHYAASRIQSTWRAQKERVHVLPPAKEAMRKRIEDQRSVNAPLAVDQEREYAVTRIQRWCWSKEQMGKMHHRLSLLAEDRAKVAEDEGPAFEREHAAVMIQRSVRAASYRRQHVSEAGMRQSAKEAMDGEEAKEQEIAAALALTQPPIKTFLARRRTQHLVNKRRDAFGQRVEADVQQQEYRYIVPMIERCYKAYRIRRETVRHARDVRYFTTTTPFQLEQERDSATHIITRAFRTIHWLQETRRGIAAIAAETDATDGVTAIEEEKDYAARKIQFHYKNHFRLFAFRKHMREAIADREAQNEQLAIAQERHDATCTMQEVMRNHRNRKSTQRTALARKVPGNGDVESERSHAASLIQRAQRCAVARQTLIRTRIEYWNRVYKVSSERITALFRGILARRQVARKRKLLAEQQRTLIENEASITLQNSYLQYRKRVRRALRDAERAAEHQRIIREEAAVMIQSQHRRVVANQRAKVLHAERVRQRRAAAALKLQCLARVTRAKRELRRLEAERDHRIRMKAAARIQGAYRSRMVRDMLTPMILAKIEREERQQLNEIVVDLQAKVRGFLVRAKIKKDKEATEFSKAVAAVGRAFMARRALGVQRTQNRAATLVQRIVRGHLGRRNRERRAKQQRADQLWHLRNQAAIMVQKHWKRHMLRELCDEQRNEIDRRRGAVRVLQGTARQWLARRELQRLRSQAAHAEFLLKLQQAATLVQCVSRGHAARQIATARRSERRSAMGLITAVVSGFQKRRFLCEKRIAFRMERAVQAIQLGWRKHISMKLARDRQLKKREHLEKIRRTENAAVVLQSNHRGYRERLRYKKLKEQREEAALKIQRRARVVIAKRASDALRQAMIVNRCARRIQARWLAVKERVQEQRHERELEQSLVAMEFKSLERHENLRRREMLLEEDDIAANLFSEYFTTMETLAEEFRIKMENWQRRAPPELQEVSATRIQSQFRGFVGRKRTEVHARAPNLSELTGDVELRATHPGSNNFDRHLVATGLRARGLARGRGAPDPELRENPTPQPAPEAPLAITNHRGFDKAPLKDSEEDLSEVVAPAPTLLDVGLASRPSKAGTAVIGEFWMSWLYRHPAIHTRMLERMLQRENHSRRKIAQDWEVGAAALSARMMASAPRTPDVSPVLAHSASVELPSELREPRPRLASVGPVLPPIRYNTDTEGSKGHDSSAVLDLANRRLTETELRPLLHALRHNTEVRVVLLGGNLLRDTACVDIADALHHNGSIEHLSLTNNPGISNTGMTQLVAYLRSSACSLKSLDISGTSVTGAYHAHVAALLARRANMPDGSLPELSAPHPLARRTLRPPRRDHRATAPSTLSVAQIPPSSLNESAAPQRRIVTTTPIKEMPMMRVPVVRRELSILEEEEELLKAQIRQETRANLFGTEVEQQ